MTIDRRLFLGGTLATAAIATPALAATIDSPVASGPKRDALNAIAAYLEAHRRHFGLPAMAMVVVDGPQVSLISSGFRDWQQRVPLAANDLWQIGSISKSFIAVICLQMQEEGKLAKGMDVDLRTYLPEAPLPDGVFTVRQLLDHTSGLPDNAAAFPPSGEKLWRGFDGGAHWSYSNTGYELLGRMIERLDGKPLAASIDARILTPLGMKDSHGGIFWRDQPRYPASYTLARPDRAPVLRPALAAAPWGEVVFGAGCVAATMPDMAKYLMALIAAGRAETSPMLAAGPAMHWVANEVVQDPKTPSETYGLGLMHRTDDGRKLLHHTGGMVCFSSSFHVDAEAKTGAFASTAVAFNMNYRPRLLTRFATQAMRRAGAGLPIGDPPALAAPALPNGADYAGSYAGPSGNFSVAAGTNVALIDGGGRTILQPLGPDIFIADAPRFADFPLVFVRDGGKVVAADWGNTRFGKDGHSAALPATPPRLAARAGRYQSDDPWTGGAVIVARGDRLYADGVQAMTEIAPDVWRPADEDWSPERVRFGGFVDGKPMWASVSGKVMERRDG